MDFNDLLGKTLKDVKVDSENDELIFTLENGTRCMLYHQQDCCEHVYIEDICGDLADLVGSPLLQVEESTNSDAAMVDSYDDSFTWTFYKMTTIKGSVTIRWYGSSHGCYSERVHFCVLS